MSRTLRALDRAVGQQGWRIVLPFQLAFIPVSLKNYGLSMVPGCSGDLFAWTNFVAELPMTIVFVYAGSAARNLADVLSGGGNEGGGTPTATLVALVVGGVGCFATVLVVKRYVGCALAELEEEGGSDAMDGAGLSQSLSTPLALSSEIGDGSWGAPADTDSEDEDGGVTLL